MKDKIAAVNTAGDRDDHLPQRLQPGRPVHQGRVLQFGGDLLEEVLQQPGGDRQRVDEVDDDQRVDVVEHVQLA
jgi:hypothetical protein